MAALVAVSLAGCGESSGVEEGAAVNVYAGATVCAGVKGALSRSAPRVDSVRVRVVCAGPVVRGGRLDLAAAGANARRATEDSSAVAYLEAGSPAVTFIRPILDEAEVALIVDRLGARAMTTTLEALRARRDGESPREAVWNR